MKKNLFLVKKWEHQFRCPKKEVLKDKKYEEALFLDEGEENVIAQFDNKDEAITYFNSMGLKTSIKESCYVWVTSEYGGE